MKTVLYADVLFLINFGMDLISVWLTFLISKRSVSPLRLIASAALGGAYGVGAVVFDARGILSFLLNAAVSFLMVVIATVPGVKMRSLAKYTFILWGIGALLGGAVTLICTLGDGSDAEFSTHNAPFFVFALAGGAVSGIVKLISSVSAVKSCRAGVSAFGVDLSLDMLVDTGCLVKEPVSGANVIFISKKAFSGRHIKDLDLLCGDISNIARLSPDIKRRARIVTVRRAGGDRALICFFPDETVLYIKNERKPVRCVAVIEDVPDYGGHDGIVPASLVR